MRSKLGSIAAVLAIAMFLTACAGDDPELEAIVPLAADADGATVYEARCASCHGTDLRGTDKGPSQLSIVYEPSHHGDNAYRSAIRTGAQQHHWAFGNMPVIESITDEQIEAVISYLRAEQQRLGFEQ